MTSDERADWLARAIDEILRDGEPPEAPAGLDHGELTSLLDAARLRMEAGHSARKASGDHESHVWARLVERLEPSRPKTPPRKSSKQAKDPPADEERELRQVIGMRMQVAREALEMAEEHRDEVWQRVKSRLTASESSPAFHARVVQEARAEPKPHFPERRRRTQSVAPATPSGQDVRSHQRWVGLSYVAVVSFVAIAAAVITAFELI